MLGLLQLTKPETRGAESAYYLRVRVRVVFPSESRGIYCAINAYRDRLDMAVSTYLNAILSQRDKIS